MNAQLLAELQQSIEVQNSEELSIATSHTETESEVMSSCFLSSELQ